MFRQILAVDFAITVESILV